VISRESLARFGACKATPAKPEVVGGFDMDGYLAKHGFEVNQRKPWHSSPGGLIYELAQCPFNPDHTGGSAAFTLAGGKPGFVCKHDGCRGKTVKDVFARYSPESGKTARVADDSEAETAGGKPRATQSQLLVEFAADAEFFHTPEGEAFASLPVGEHREVWPLKSGSCRRWLIRVFYQRLGKPPGAQAMQNALALLEAKAQFDSPARQIFTRVAPCGDAIYIDLCNDRWEAVELTSKGWNVVQNPPVRFRRSRGMQPLPYPARDGSISQLRSLINVGGDKNWILLLAWLVAACRPQGPYPLLILQGEQGSAKSTTAKLLRRIIDPATASLRTPPREERDLLIAANNSRVVAYDNLSGIPQWLPAHGGISSVTPFRKIYPKRVLQKRTLITDRVVNGTGLAQPVPRPSNPGWPRAADLRLVPPRRHWSSCQSRQVLRRGKVRASPDRGRSAAADREQRS
jgi:hypothetical protein